MINIFIKKKTNVKHKIFKQLLYIKLYAKYKQKITKIMKIIKFSFDVLWRLWGPYLYFMQMYSTIFTYIIPYIYKSAKKKSKIKIKIQNKRDKVININNYVPKC